MTKLIALIQKEADKLLCETHPEVCKLRDENFLLLQEKITAKLMASKEVISVQTALAALNSLSAQNPSAIYNAVLEGWIAYLKSTQEVFRQGLLNRVNDLFKPIAPTSGSALVPVAHTGGLERAQRIIAGASKGNQADIVAIGAGFIGVMMVFISILKITK